MADGLTADDLDSILPAKPAARELSAKGADSIRAEIYARHGIPSDTPAKDAAALIEQAASDAGHAQSAWANPEERAAAREAYARQGRTPNEVRARWGESAYLLDPRTYQYMQRYGRDADFLLGTTPGEPQSELDAMHNPPADWWASHDAIRHYETSRNRPLSDAGGWNPVAPASGYQRFGGFKNAIANNVSNPDVPLGAYMQASEVVPNFLRMQGSGETDTASESWRRAQAARLANNRYRLNSPHPVLDVPSGSAAPVLAERMKALQGEIGSASIPFAEERWHRTEKTTPPGFVADAADFGLSMADPTIVFPVAKTASAIGKAGKMAAVAGELLSDAASEQVVGTGLQGALGGIPGRTGKQFLMGGGEPGQDFFYKDDEALQKARRDGDALHARLSGDASIENADREAYQRLVNSGAIDPFSSQGLTPQGRLNPRSPLNKQ